jgi:hypothetical protein
VGALFGLGWAMPVALNGKRRNPVRRDGRLRLGGAPGPAVVLEHAGEFEAFEDGVLNAAQLSAHFDDREPGVSADELDQPVVAFLPCLAAVGAAA